MHINDKNISLDEKERENIKTRRILDFSANEDSDSDSDSDSRSLAPSGKERRLVLSPFGAVKASLRPNRHWCGTRISSLEIYKSVCGEKPARRVVLPINRPILGAR